MNINKEYRFKFSGYYDHEITNLSDIVHELSLNATDIHHAVAMVHGIDAWFLAYTTSEEYRNLSDGFRKEAFNAFLGIRSVLAKIESSTKEA